VRVVVVSGIFPPDIGGPATHAADLAAELRERGHGVRVLSLWDGADVHDDGTVLRFPRRWSWPLRLGAVAGWLVSNRSRYDVVYATGMLPAAVAGARAAGRPVVVKVVGDPVWERGLREGLVAGEFEGFQRAGGGGVRVRGMRWVRDRSLRAATLVTAPSEYLAAVIDGWLGGPAAVDVIPNGVRVTPRRSRRRPSRTSLVFVGRLVPHKRVERLLDAVGRTDGVRIDVVGDGPERAALEEEAARIGVTDRAAFHGDVSHDEVIDRIGRADALVLASDYEGLPHVVLEALAAGTPVVSPSVGGIGEIVHDEVEGLLVPDASVDSFVQAFARLRDDAGLRARLREGARAAGRRWRFDRTAERIEEALGLSRAPARRVVFFGKTRVPEPGASLGELRGRYETLARRCRATVIGVGRPGRRWIGRTRTIAFPDVGPIGSIAFHALGPVVAIVVAGGRGAVVCQSPYEGFGVGVLSSILPGRWRPHVVVEVHGDWRSATRLYGGAARGVLSPFADRAAAWAIRRADAVRVIGDFTEALVRDAGYRGPVDTYVAYSDFSAFLGMPPVPLPKEPVVLFAGALERVKGIDLLIEAWPGVRALEADARLVVCGDGSLERAMRERAGALGVGDAVSFLGSRTRAEVAGAMDAAMVVAVPSRSEGLGRVGLEAFGRGRPVVASNVGGLPELIGDGSTGLLVPPEDPESLARALAGLIGDRKRAHRMGDEARRVAQERDPAAEFDRGIARLAAWAAP